MFRMGVHDGSDLPERFVEFDMRRGVRRGPVMPLDHLPSEIDNYHIFCGKFLVGHPARFDHDQSGFPVNGGNISPRKQHQTVFYQIEIRTEHLLFQLFQHMQ